MTIKKILYWIPTVLFYIVFGSILGIFHLLQLVGLAIGYQTHKGVVDMMIHCLNASLLLVGARRSIDWRTDAFPTDKPMLIVSNHQSMFDIPNIGSILMRHHPKFIAKYSLAKGIPSISINIRKGGSIYINRKNKEEAIQKIQGFAAYLNINNFAGSIFPEGTRTRDGQVAPFRKSGLATLLELMPDATIVPLVLQNYWKLGKYRMKPIPFGLQLKTVVLPAVDRSDKDVEAIIEELETQIQEVAKELD
ncbi:MAG: lysophospholipid acyltransferase family protein [Bacteroidota bacterium]